MPIFLENQVWVEITYFEGRGAEQDPLFGVSNSLWSPLTTIDGKDYYGNMKAVKVGDFIIHLAKQKRSSKQFMLCGVSVAADEATIFDMPPNTHWGDEWRKKI
jgi:hypothetical protein